MSIHSSVMIANGAAYDVTPGWMRSERYDFCEPLEEKKEHTGWFQKILSLFA